MITKVILQSYNNPFGVEIRQEEGDSTLFVVSNCCQGNIYFNAIGDSYWYCSKCRRTLMEYQTKDGASSFRLLGTNIWSLDVWIAYWTGLPTSQFTAEVIT